MIISLRPTHKYVNEPLQIVFISSRTFILTHAENNRSNEEKYVVLSVVMSLERVHVY